MLVYSQGLVLGGAIVTLTFVSSDSYGECHPGQPAQVVHSGLQLTGGVTGAGGRVGCLGMPGCYPC